ncbi:MAG: type II toxin-antitoxin system HicB family antitoxin [Candidatus Riflebacteria bacterium]|nr:type II toxin-antitoxin system HicB family antitoxin [Candidatus Riflebacteria bacterium]
MNKSYTLVYWKENGHYVGKIREMPIVHGMAATIEELETKIQNSYRQLTKDLPQPASLKTVQTRPIILNPG